jgi:hypothetical protein
MEKMEIMLNSLISCIFNMIALIPADRRARTHNHEEMRIAVMDAFHKTEAYYRARASGSNNNNDTELEIAQAWSKASILVEKYDKNLAERLGKKSQFWRDSGLWNDAEIKSAGIDLKLVQLEAMTLDR